MRSISSVLVVPLLIILSSCGLVDAEVCTAAAHPGISVIVTDSVSGGRVSSNQIQLRAVDGSYQDSVVVSNAEAPFPIRLAEERAGTYLLDILAGGYRPWSRQGISVSQDDCHVRTVNVSALLQRGT